MEDTVHEMEHQLAIEAEDSPEDSDLLVVDVNNPEIRSYRHWSDCYIYASTSGMVGGFSVLFASVVSKLLFHDAEKGLQEGFFYASVGKLMLVTIFFLKRVIPYTSQEFIIYQTHSH